MDKTRTSKLISLVLRHKPEVIGITLDEHGWANVADLIAGVNKIRPLTMELLEEIVRTDDKQRFSFNEDKTKIRANQGHSIPVDVELEEVEPPEYLWHGTGEKYRESIEQNGLIAKTRLYVHLSADEEMAIKVGARHGRPIVFQVSTGQMHRDGYRFFRSVNGVWLTKYVPAVYLQLLQDQPQKQAEPGNSPQLELTDRQLKICHAVIDAAAALEKQYSIDLYSNRIQIYPTVDETLARGIRQFFDLYQMSVGEKHDGLRHVTGIEDTASLIAAYKEAFSSISGGEFSVEEVVSLRKQFSEYLKDYTAQHKTRPRKLYIADPHFFHNRLCAEMDRRGFSGYEEMNDYMIRQWNAKVTQKDEVYILGDFSIAKAKATEGILKKLNGKKYLITGNHDKFLADKQFDTSLFRWIKPYEEIRDNGRRVILSHYPVFCYPGQYRKGEDGSPLTYMLYGHVHNSQDERLVHHFITETRKAQVKSRHADGPEPIPCNMINCFCMFSDYQPMTLNEWIEIDCKRRDTLDAEFSVSANTLATMDAAVQCFVNGGAADPLDLPEIDDDMPCEI